MHCCLCWRLANSCLCFAVVLDGLAPRHPALEHFWIVHEIPSGHLRQDVAQILFWIDAACLARLDEAVDGSARFRSLRAVAEEPVLPSDREGTDGALCHVVRHGDAPVAQVAAEALLRMQGIVHRLGGLEFRRDFRADGFQPHEEVLDQGLFLAEAFFLPLFRRKVLQFSFHGRDGADLLYGLPCLPTAVLRIPEDGFPALPRVGRQPLHEFPAHVRPAGGMLRVKAVVAGELVMYEGAVESFEELRGVLAAPAGAVLENADVRALGIQRARGVEPHVGLLLLPSGTLGALPVDLHGRLVSMEYGRGDEAFLHVSDEREEVVLAERDGPVRHVRPAERKSEPRPCAFLPVERDGEYVFLAEDVGRECRRGDGVREEGGRDRSALDAEAVFLLARGALVDLLVDVENFHLRRSVADLRPQELPAHLHERYSRMAVAEAFPFREFADVIFVRKAFQQLVAVPLRLSCVRLHGSPAGNRLGLACPGFLLSFVEERELLIVRLENAELLGLPSEHGLAELLVPDERGFELLLEGRNLFQERLVLFLELPVLLAELFHFRQAVFLPSVIRTAYHRGMKNTGKSRLCMNFSRAAGWTELPDRGLLLDGEPLHEPAELLRRDAPRLGSIARPLEAAVFQPLVEKQEAVALPEQPLDAVGAPAAEEEEGAGEGIHLELPLDDGSEAVDGLAHVGAAACEVDLADGGKVEKAHGSPSPAAASFRRSDTGVSSASSNWNGPQETRSLSRGSGVLARTAMNSGRCAEGAGVLPACAGNGVEAAGTASTLAGTDASAERPEVGRSPAVSAPPDGFGWCRYSGCSSSSSSRILRSQ